MVAELQPLVDQVWRHFENTGNRGRTGTLKVKFADFEIMSRSRPSRPPSAAETISSAWLSDCCSHRSSQAHY